MKCLWIIFSSLIDFFYDLNSDFFYISLLIMDYLVSSSLIFPMNSGIICLNLFSISASVTWLIIEMFDSFKIEGCYSTFGSSKSGFGSSKSGFGSSKSGFSPSTLGSSIISSNSLTYDFSAVNFPESDSISSSRMTLTVSSKYSSSAYWTKILTIFPEVSSIILKSFSLARVI